MLNVHLRISDDTGKPTPVRLRLSAEGGAQFPPLGRAAEFASGRAEDVGAQLKLGRERWWHIDGACEIPLPAGVPLRVQATKGPVWEPLSESVTLGAGQISLRFALRRACNTEGWVSVDTRAHFVPPHAALLEARAEGLDVANVLAVPLNVLALDANTYTTVPNLLAFSGQVPAVEAAGAQVVVNTFNVHPVLGKLALLNSHRPVFPLAFGGPEDTDDWGLCDWCDQCHRKKGVVVWCDAFEPAGGIAGGEALVAAVLGKIDAVEVTDAPRKAPLLPWVYRLWDAGVRVPLVGASAKDSNRTPLGAMRTWVKPDGGTWLDCVRTGCTVASAGPLLTLTRDGDSFRARGFPEPVEVELLSSGQVVASGAGAVEAEVSAPGWVAARTAGGPFAHTSPVWVGEPARDPRAVQALLRLVQQTVEWAREHGHYANPKRRAALLERCAEARAKLEAPA
jgi:hypothetical protein